MWGLGDVDKHPVMSRKILITSTCQPFTLEKNYFAINTLLILILYIHFHILVLVLVS